MAKYKCKFCEGLEQHVPNDFEKDCNAIMNALNHNISQTTREYKIDVLKQCLDVLRMEQ